MKYPVELTKYTADQCYSQYASEDFKVWEKSFNQQLQLLNTHSEYIEPTYISGFHKLGFTSDKIPTVEDLNYSLRELNWSIVFVDRHVPALPYMRFIARGIFPIARNIRSLQQFNNSPSPDLIHDIFGHLPMLFSDKYREFLLGVTAPVEELNLKHDSLLFIHLNRLFLWSIEFGLIGTPKDHKYFGAGILSSPTQLNNIRQGNIKIEPYSLEVAQHAINYDGIQDKLFAAEDFEQFNDILNKFLGGNAKLYQEYISSELLRTEKLVINHQNNKVMS